MGAEMQLPISVGKAASPLWLGSFALPKDDKAVRCEKVRRAEGPKRK